MREHAALQLVARETSPAELFAAVTRETGELLGAQRTTLLRVDSPQRARVAAAWSTGGAPPVPVGHTAPIDEGRGILGRMLREPRPVPVDLDVQVPGRFDAGIEAAAYFVVSEALTNIAKYAEAATAIVSPPGKGTRLSAEFPATVLGPLNDRSSATASS